MISINFLILILFYHWVMDFVAQTRHVAETKSESFTTVFMHACLYMMPAFVINAIAFVFNQFYLPTYIAFSSWIFVNGIAHLVQDFYTSRTQAYLHTQNKTKLFWNSLGFDQFAHIAFAVLSYKWIILPILSNG